MRAKWLAMFVVVALSTSLRPTSRNVDDLVRTTCAGAPGLLPDTAECRLCAKLGAPALFSCRRMCGKPIDTRDLEHLRCLMTCSADFYTGVQNCIEATRSGKDGSKK